MCQRLLPALLAAILPCLFFGGFAARATVFGQVHGVVHDPQHRPIAGARIAVQSVNSSLVLHAITGPDGSFALSSVPLGDYRIRVQENGFAISQQTITLASDTSPTLHFELAIASPDTTVSVTTTATAGNGDSVTPTTLLDRRDIAQTPGADRTNSLSIITDFVPGAYITHDMLHMRGGHQVSWLIDGIAIPNTNIASNLGAQIDPKDIDYIETQRGSYTADVGDRTYGVFNVVPRTGFERDRKAELVLSAGSFLQTNDQLNFGDHTQRMAYYASITGNRGDYGLAPPTAQVVHDAANGVGGFASLIDNATPADQLRLVTQLRRDFFQIPYDPNAGDFENVQYDSSGLRDTQQEIDALAAFSWLHTFSHSTVAQVSPFYHFNLANYDAPPTDQPVATTDHRSSNYGGGQLSLTTILAHNTLQGGTYFFDQYDNNFFGVTGAPSFTQSDATNGSVVEEFVADNYQVNSWLTLLAGLRQTRFKGQFTEDATSPRFGAALRVPKLNWVFRAFYGRFYQPPPLLTLSGPVLQFAEANDTAFAPLHGERDEEHQFGVQIPLPGRLAGWLLDADTFKTRVNNFLDHSNIGDSSIYFPVTVDGALIRAWELTLRSPRLWRLGQVHLAYSNQIAEQRGNITGGLICTPVGDPACNAGFTYTPVDHDQRNTLNVGFTAQLPGQAYASTNLYYGSGFQNGDPDPATPYPNDYLPHNTSLDLSVGKRFSDRLEGSVSATNLANRRVLLDNSLTFGGFHYSDPRQVFAELRYRFHY